jgi:hypothetical protein
MHDVNYAFPLTTTREEVLAPVDEAALTERRERLVDLGREVCPVDGREALSRRESESL